MTEQEQRGIFQSWLDQYRGVIFKIVRAYTDEPMDRDDLFQDIAAQVWNSIPSFRNACKPTTWIYRVALNTAITWARKERKHADARQLGHHLLQEQDVHAGERLAWLYAEIRKLNEVDRSIILLLLDEFTYQEMADILGITASNVGVRINRIKKQLTARSKTHHHGL